MGKHFLKYFHPTLSFFLYVSLGLVAITLDGWIQNLESSELGKNQRRPTNTVFVFLIASANRTTNEN